MKEANNMPSDDWSLIVQKATIYDLMRIIEEAPGKTYTQEELKKLFDAYITGALWSLASKVESLCSPATQAPLLYRDYSRLPSLELSVLCECSLLL